MIITKVPPSTRVFDNRGGHFVVLTRLVDKAYLEVKKRQDITMRKSRAQEESKQTREKVRESGIYYV